MNRIITSLKVIKVFNNWPIYFLDHFGLLKFLRKKEIIYSLRNGFKFKVRPATSDCERIKEIWSRYDYTPKGFFITENDLVIDIDAHIGIFSIFAANLAKRGRVYASNLIPKTLNC